MHERLLNEAKDRERRTLAQEHGVVLSEKEFIASTYNELDFRNPVHAPSNGQRVGVSSEHFVSLFRPAPKA